MEIYTSKIGQRQIYIKLGDSYPVGNYSQGDNLAL